MKRVYFSFVSWLLRRSIVAAKVGSNKRALMLSNYATQLAPERACTQLWLGRTALNAGDVSKMTAAVRAALEVSSHIHCRQYCRAISLLLEAQCLADAEEHLKTARELFPQSTRVWKLNGELQRYQSNERAAIYSFMTAMALASTEEEQLGALQGLANCYTDSGERDRAISIYRQMIALSPTYANAYIDLIECLDSDAIKDEVIPLLRRALSLGRNNAMQSRDLHCAIGKAYDRVGRTGSAFAHFRISNTQRTALRGRFNVEQWNLLVEARIRLFNSELIHELSKYGSQSDFLICVVGMPRSGTSMIEQILATNSKVCGLGERLDFQRAIDWIEALPRSRGPYPMCCNSALTPEVIRDLSRSVEERLRMAAGPYERVITKLPGDLWDLGLIRILFPKVRIIHARRNPLDTCLSCYMQSFRDVPFSAHLDDLARMYPLYEKIMLHWNQVLPATSICEIEYESLIERSETIVEGLFSFCGLDFEVDWAKFHSKARRIDTPSKWQVHRPLYNSAVRKWKKYAEFLGPLLALDVGVK